MTSVRPNIAILRDCSASNRATTTTEPRTNEINKGGTGLSCSTDQTRPHVIAAKVVLVFFRLTPNRVIQSLEITKGVHGGFTRQLITDTTYHTSRSTLTLGTYL